MALHRTPSDLDRTLVKMLNTTDSPPEYNESEAKGLVALCRCPPTENPQDAGLRAAFAVAKRRCFSRDKDAWEHYESKRQRYYEWSKCPELSEEATQAVATAAAEMEEAATVVVDELFANGQCTQTDQHHGDLFIYGDLHVTGTVFTHSLEAELATLTHLNINDRSVPDPTGGCKKKWYVVFTGYETGVFFEAWDGADGVNRKVKGFSSALVKTFKTKTQAQSAWVEHIASTV